MYMLSYWRRHHSGVPLILNLGELREGFRIKEHSATVGSQCEVGEEPQGFVEDEAEPDPIRLRTR